MVSNTGQPSLILVLQGRSSNCWKKQEEQKVSDASHMYKKKQHACNLTQYMPLGTDLVVLQELFMSWGKACHWIVVAS